MDATARAMGFRGALLPDVFVYGHAMRLAVQNLAPSPARSARTYTQWIPHENREAWSIHHPLIGFVRVTTDSGEQGWGQVST